MIEVYVLAIAEDSNNQTKRQDLERRELMAQVETLNTHLQNARIQKVDGISDDDDCIKLACA